MSFRFTRRDALKGGAAASLESLAGSGRKLRLGAPLFLKSDDPRELAREARRLGYSAAYCPRSKPGDKDRLKAIEHAFAAEDVVLAEYGVWVNMLVADPAERRANLQQVIDGLAVAEETGTRCCVDIAGSFHPKVWYGPDPRNLSQEFFDAAVENARKIIDAVKPRRARFAYEMMGWNLPDSPDSYLRLLAAIDRPAFAVHIDIANGVNCPERFYSNAAFTADCFRKLGRHIVSCHAKDLDWIPEMNLHFIEVVPGRGKLDYKAYLRGLAGLPSDVPLMLEHLRTPEEYAEGARFISSLATSMGLRPA